MALQKKINGFVLNPIGIGTWLMGGGVYPDKTAYAIYGSEEKEIAAIQYSLNAGQNHIDTAQMYGAGHTEEIVGQTMCSFDRKKIFLASKLWKSHLKRSAVIPAIEGMLQRLQTDYLDLVYIHSWWGEFEPLQETLQGLNLALDQKLIRAIGVSNYTLDQLQQAVSLTKHPISAIQNYYSLTNRSWVNTDLFSFCSKNTIAFVACRPLDHGKISQKIQKILARLSEKYHATPHQIALRWLLKQENVHVIPKATDPHHIDENIAALTIPLADKDCEILDRIV